MGDWVAIHTPIHRPYIHTYVREISPEILRIYVRTYIGRVRRVLRKRDKPESFKILGALSLALKPYPFLS